MKAGAFTPARVTQSVSQYKQYQLKCNVFLLKKWYELVQLVKRSTVLANTNKDRTIKSCFFALFIFLTRESDIILCDKTKGFRGLSDPWYFIVRVLSLGGYPISTYRTSTWPAASLSTFPSTVLICIWTDHHGNSQLNVHVVVSQTGQSTTLPPSSNDLNFDLDCCWSFQAKPVRLQLYEAQGSRRGNHGNITSYPSSQPNSAPYIAGSRSQMAYCVKADVLLVFSLFGYHGLKA